VFPYVFYELVVELLAEWDDVFQRVGPEDDGSFISLYEEH